MLPEFVREMCGNCMATKNKDEEYDERLHQLERKGLSLPKGSGGFRAVPQMDAYQYFNLSKGVDGDNGDVRDLLPRSKLGRSIPAPTVFS